jgi:ABC-2 type transport system permease protein
MLRSAFFLARKDVQYMLRERETLLWIFIMPVVFFFFIGTITGGFSDTGNPDRPDPLVVEASPEAGFLAAHLTKRLETTGFRIYDPDSVSLASKVPRLFIPTDFTDSVLAGHPMTLTLTRRNEGLGADYDEIRIQRASYSVLADLVTAAESGSGPTPEALDAILAAPRTLTLEVSRAGRRHEIPTGFDQAVPGTMVMFTLMVLLTTGAILLVIERNQGLLRRLASSPMPRSGIIAGKWGGRIALAAVQIGFAMVLGRFLFKVDWGPNLPMLLVVLFFYAALLAMVGIVLGNLVRTEGQAVGIGVLSANVLAAMGGCWWPIEITQPWMQKLALFLPTGWAMDAMHKLVSFGAPASSVLPHIGVMFAASIVMGWIAVRTFRFQ